MECNKEEALKAKQIAELKVAESDYAGAKRFALKAQSLYPDLDGLPQFLTTLNVYTSAEKGTNGEVDWCKVLGVGPMADEDTIQKQFRKLALVLHPDKNKCAGAEGAFKILSYARRILYEQKYTLRSMHVGVPGGRSSMPTTQNGFQQFFYTRDEGSAIPTMPGGKSSMPTAQNGFQDFFKSNINIKDERSSTPTMPDGKSAMPTTQNGYKDFFRSKTSSTRSATPTVPCHTKPSGTKPLSTSHPQKGLKHTFWTICSFCRMYFEYLRKYLNHKLQCHNCKKQFIAYKIPAPKYAFKSTPFDEEKLRQPTIPSNSSDPGRTHAATADVGSSGFCGVDKPMSAPGRMHANPAFGQSNRGHEESVPYKEHQQWNLHVSGSPSAGPSAVPNGTKPRRKRHQRKEMHTQAGMGNGGVATNKVFGSSQFSNGTGSLDAASRHRANSRREISDVEVKNILMRKGINEVVKKLDKPTISSVPKTVDGKEVKEKGKKEAVSDVKVDMTRCKVSVATKNMPSKVSSPAISHDESDVEEGNTNSMTVPDPDFHDFDKDRTEESFSSNQVWAVYDEDDGMPRYYAMVHSVLSLKPFKIRISWLNSKTNHELAPLNWVDCGFPKTSGDLYIGKHQVYKYLHSFSHKVRWTKGRRGAVRIYPGKGDVWALYRNWSSDWTQLTPDEVIHKYDMVQVVQDSTEEGGVNIVPLVKVAGFKTVFRQHPNRRKIRTIPREEIFRFSHQVPYYFLTGREGENVPMDCLELDPASTPLELLQVKSEAEVEMVKMDGKCNGEENGKVTTEAGMVEDAVEKDSADLKREKTPEATEWQVYSRKRPKEGQVAEGAKRLRLKCT